MSHWSTDLIIDNIHDLIGTIQFLQMEIDSLAAEGKLAEARDLYEQKLLALKRLGELEQSISL